MACQSPLGEPTGKIEQNGTKGKEGALPRFQMRVNGLQPCSCAVELLTLREMVWTVGFSVRAAEISRTGFLVVRRAIAGGGARMEITVRKYGLTRLAVVLRLRRFYL
jgi:hypothetical protein